MTDVTNSENQGAAGLPAADEQLLKELAERARADGLKLTGEDGLLGKLTKMVIEGAEALASRFPPGEQPAALGRAQNNISLFLNSQGDYARALQLQQSALAIAEAALGPDHPDTAIRLNNLAVTYRDLGRYVEALPLQERALAVTEAALGPDHPDTAIRLDNLAATYRDLGRPADAAPLEERARRIRQRPQ